MNIGTPPRQSAYTGKSLTFKITVSAIPASNAPFELSDGHDLWKKVRHLMP
ncbi:MAG: hypothetical protein JXQ99_20070 [Hyphomicrobiaceae bacterium]